MRSTAKTHLMLTAALVLLALVTPAASAVPSTPEIEASAKRALAARADLDRMHDELEVLVEEHNAIIEELDEIRQLIAETREDLAVAEADLAEANETLQRRATEMYKRGGTSVIEVLFGTKSFQDLLGRVDLARRISRADAHLVAGVKEAKAAVEASELVLEQRETEQIALRAEAESRRTVIEAEVAKQKAFVADLDAETKRLIAAEEERQRKLAEERARIAAAAAAAAAAAPRDIVDQSSLGAGHPEVVPVALRYVGVPYVWGGASPSGFDCSGLCQYSYKQIGISIPRTSRTQFRAGQHISRDRLDLLKPGDLVFFGTNGDADRVHHVGIYVGNGDFIHAPETGAFVRVESLIARIQARGDYVGASRL
jgi:cell wall-associated NlpC family hydrolase